VILQKVDFSSKQPTLQEVVGISVDIGDVLLLKKKAYCPADIVLLDCKDDWCFVDTIEIDGCS
jgi:magnesium-transporting ATPase (P-type)